MLQTCKTGKSTFRGACTTVLLALFKVPKWGDEIQYSLMILSKRTKKDKTNPHKSIFLSTHQIGNNPANKIHLVKNTGSIQLKLWYFIR